MANIIAFATWIFSFSIVFSSKKIGARASAGIFGSDFEKIYTCKDTRHALIRRYPPSQENQNKKTFFVVFTGGSGSGKTKVIERLRELGYNTIDETALKVMEDWRAQGKDPVANQYEFQKMIAIGQAAKERAALERGGVVFLDGSVLDGIAYCDLRSAERPREIWDCATSHRYDRVFVFDTLDPFPDCAEGGRQSNYQQSLDANKKIIEVYKSLGYDPIIVSNSMSIEERTHHVLKNLVEVS